MYCKYLVPYGSLQRHRWASYPLGTHWLVLGDRQFAGESQRITVEPGFKAHRNNSDAPPVELCIRLAGMLLTDTIL